MLSVERCREILGDKAAGMTDAQMEQARDQLYVLARIVIDMYHDEEKRRMIEAEMQTSRDRADLQEERGP